MPAIKAHNNDDALMLMVTLRLSGGSHAFLSPVPLGFSLSVCMDFVHPFGSPHHHRHRMESLRVYGLLGLASGRNLSSNPPPPLFIRGQGISGSAAALPRRAQATLMAAQSCNVASFLPKEDLLPGPHHHHHQHHQCWIPLNITQYIIRVVRTSVTAIFNREDASSSL